MSFMTKVKEMLGQNSGKAKQAVDKAGDMVDKRTGGKYADKVDKAQKKAGEHIDRGQQQQGRDTGPPNTPGTPGA
ncbi:antitoxin [Thermomonospora umbrina]|uniref:Antitoxin protein of toxin-antitoxin system n=1 Tax=Thermomonospora umbrina TaxID=111806 RepID=A0A3D9SYZ5_9ACTN|nr:antitoxin [Thermomonospora umbrina]REE99263.1 antitoxin protein of toxin-antitoxin system [Thermomonospora umbrina]